MRSSFALCALLLLLSLGSGCLRRKTPASSAPSPASASMDGGSAQDHTAALALPSLAQKFAADFDVGTAVMPFQTRDVPDILVHHFSRLTAENDMKFGAVCPSPKCNFTAADEIADFARQHGMKMSGHTFVWHQMQPGWVFQDQGRPAGRELVSQRLREHIFTLTKRYADVVDNWDVVNEAISDTPGKTYRDLAEGSPWFKTFGSRDYIKLAFQYAAEAAAVHDPTVKLYYNDYNIVIPEKRAKVIELVRWLRSEGVRIDGVGEQGHFNIEWPSTTDIAAAIDEFAAENLEVKISELDVSLYAKDDHAGKKWQPVMEFTPALQERLAQRYAELFHVFRSKGAVLTQVTFWGVSDDHTWLNSWPIGRRNDPLLLDRNHQPKAAFRTVLER
jgi:endo-1,4-beta-xylanase